MSTQLPPVNIVVCDDDERLRRSLVRTLSEQGAHCIASPTGDEALSVVRSRSDIGLLLLDLIMPGMDGLQVLERLRREGCSVPVLLLTANATVDLAVRATKLGCVNVMSKPYGRHELVAQVREALALRPVHGNGGASSDEKPGYGRLLGQSSVMQELFQRLRKMEKLQFTAVHIHGESGTGKELVAQELHKQGIRHERPYVEVDCSTVPEPLLDSTLFGHERGAFTDARATRKGLFELADDGILFLDEIGELSAAAQVKLLRVLEARTFRRVGGSRNLPVRAAIVTATNRDLELEATQGRFRQDLYYRLSVLHLHTPALRERREDIALLADHFLDDFSRRYRRSRRRLAPDALDSLLAYGWPGNVRELRNIMEQVVVFSARPDVHRRDLPPALQSFIRGGTPAFTDTLQLPEHGIRLKDVERSLVEQALHRTEGNQSAAARLLDISRHTFRTLMKRYDLL